MRTCPLGPAPESSLSRRPASRPVLVCPGPHRCAHDPVSAYFSFSLRVSVSLRPSKPLYLCLPVSRPPTFNPLHPPSNPGVSLLSATPSGSPCSLAGSLCSFSRLSVLLLLGLSVLFLAFCSLFPGLSAPSPISGSPFLGLCRVSWCLCLPRTGISAAPLQRPRPPPHSSGMLPLWFFHPRVGEGLVFLLFSTPPRPPVQGPQVGTG